MIKSKHLISIVLLGCVISQLNFSALLEQFHTFNLLMVLASLILIICQIFFLNIRWHYLLNNKSSHTTFETSSAINIAGYFANILFITSIGGIITKSGLAMRHGIGFTRAVFLTFYDRFMTLFSLIVLSALGLPFLKSVLAPNLLLLVSAAVVLIIIASFCLFALLRLRAIRESNYFSEKQKRLISIMYDTISHTDFVFKIVVHSVIAQACFLVSAYALFLSFETSHSINHLHFFALLPILSLISAMPISFGGWGVREGAFVFGLGLIGFPMESAFLLSVQIGLITLIAPILVGIPYFLKSDLRALIIGNHKSLESCHDK